MAEYICRYVTFPRQQSNTKELVAFCLHSLHLTNTMVPTISHRSDVLTGGEEGQTEVNVGWTAFWRT